MVRFFDFGFHFAAGDGAAPPGLAKGRSGGVVFLGGVDGNGLEGFVSKGLGPRVSASINLPSEGVLEFFWSFKYLLGRCLDPLRVLGHKERGVSLSFLLTRRRWGGDESTA